MQICIPNVGDHLELNCNWEIGIVHNYDNVPMLKYLNIPFQYYVNGQCPVTSFVIPKGAVLKIEQVYIRKGSADLSSLKFLWRNPPSGKTIRFQAMLADVNRIDCELLV